MDPLEHLQGFAGIRISSSRETPQRSPGLPQDTAERGNMNVYDSSSRYERRCPYNNQEYEYMASPEVEYEESPQYEPVVLSAPCVARQPVELSRHLYFPLRTQSRANMVSVAHFFVAEELRSDLARRAALGPNLPPPEPQMSRSANPMHVHTELPSTNSFPQAAPKYTELPEHVHCFHTIAPLEANMSTSTLLLHSCGWYSGVSQRDGQTYALLRLADYKLRGEELLSAVVASWSVLNNPNVVKLHEAFTTSAFGLSSSLVLVYDYFPGCVPLVHSINTRLTEANLWSYMFQLLNLIHEAHACGLCLRLLDAKKILVTAPGRIRVNCLGALDFVYGAATPDEFQKDFYNLGVLVLQLLTSQLNAEVVDLQTASILRMLESFSPELQSAVRYFLDPSVPKSYSAFLSMFPSQCVREFSILRHKYDFIEGELLKCLENGRLARLMMKLLFVLERPEKNYDVRWSETGDRYFVKLFRDYVFHTNDSNGDPIIDVGHVVSCLNKVDAGVNEKIMLTSRDSRNALIVGYQEIKRCLQESFLDLYK